MRVRRLAANLGLAALVLLGLELLCRASEDTSKYAVSADWGYRLAPGHQDGDETVNAAGLRGAELEPEGERVRLLAMGGSTTWGHKVDDDETWPHLLQERLGDGFEVLNGGVSGWGLEQIVRALEDDYIERLRPDLVLVYSGWNHPVLEGNPNVARYRARAVDPTVASGLRRSALVRRLQDWLKQLEPEPPGRTTAERLARRAEIAAQMQDAFPPLCAALARLSAERDVPVVLVRYPGLLGVRPAPDGASDALYDERLAAAGHPGLARAALLADAREQYVGGLGVVEAAAADAGLPLLDVAGAMLTELPDDPAERARAWARLFRDRMHLTPAGNAAVADAVARELEARGLLASLTRRARGRSGPDRP